MSEVGRVIQKIVEEYTEYLKLLTRREADQHEKLLAMQQHLKELDNQLRELTGNRMHAEEIMRACYESMLRGSGDGVEENPPYPTA